MILFSTIYMDANILPHFLKHYSEIGITEFHFSVNLRDNKHIHEQAKSLIGDFNVSFDVIKDVPETSNLASESINMMRVKYCKPDDWIVVTDLDELFEPGCSLQELINKCDDRYDHVFGVFVDRVSVDGSIPQMVFDKSIESQFPHKINLTKKLLKALDYKVVLQKGRHRVHMGHHKILGDVRLAYPIRFPLNHYKWHGNVIEKLEIRNNLMKRHGNKKMTECDRFLQHYKKYGKINIADWSLPIKLL